VSCSPSIQWGILAHAHAAIRYLYSKRAGTGGNRILMVSRLRLRVLFCKHTFLVGWSILRAPIVNTKAKRKTPDIAILHRHSHFNSKSSFWARKNVLLADIGDIAILISLRVYIYLRQCRSNAVCFAAVISQLEQKEARVISCSEREMKSTPLT
jgi:hypothetical protein